MIIGRGMLKFSTFFSHYFLRCTNLNRLWIDQANALKIISESAVEDYIKKAANDLVVDGIAIIRGAHSAESCKAVIEDYESYRKNNLDYVLQNLDANGNEKRLVDFHHTSKAAERIGNNNEIMKLLDFIFGMEAGIYTSLTFKFGTQQPVHRDTPHFATWPENYFCGVWTALEDVDPDSGPLFYFKNAHRFSIDARMLMEQAQHQIEHESDLNKLLHALDLYNGRVIDQTSKLGPPVILDMKAGDTVIWHAQTPHGGLPARNVDKTRWSIVFHCAPVAIQVYQHDAFFRFAGKDNPGLFPRYGFRKSDGRKIAVAGQTAYM